MQRRGKLILAAAVTGPVLVLGGLRLGLNSWVGSRAAAALHAKFGVEVEYDDIALSTASGHARFLGVRATDQGAPLIEVDEVEISASIRDLVAGTYEFRELILTRPVFHVVVEKSENGETTNFGRIYAGRKPPTRDRQISFLDARVVGGRCVLDDAITDHDHPAHLEFEGLTASAADLQLSGKSRFDDPGDFRVDALLAQKHVPARISLVGWAPPPHQAPTFALHAAITGLSLDGLSQYVKDSTRRALGGDTLHLVGTLRAHRGVIADGAIAARVLETDDKLSMRIGGTTSELVFDQDSKLALLFHVPFLRLGKVGDVSVTSTWGAAKEMGAGVYEAGEAVVGGVTGTVKGMLQLDPLGALEAAGGGIFKGAKKLGGGVFDAFGRLFGRNELREKPEKLDAEFAKVHAKRRRSMLEAAFESAHDGSDARRARIETELEVPQPRELDVALGGAGASSN